jgi:hypothetical protein
MYRFPAESGLIRHVSTYFFLLYRQEQLATIIGKSQSTISRSPSLNRFPKEIRDKCRRDPTVQRNILVEIARKKQERSMLTPFQKYQGQQGKIAAKETAAAAAPAQRKRTRAEAIVNTIAQSIMSFPRQL